MNESSRLLAEARDKAGKWIEFRRELHRRPEPSLEESETARAVMRRLDGLGLPYRSGVGGHGIVAEIAGGRPGATIALRADMDALPIEEDADVPFASEKPGLMHACGHDAHTAILLGAAELLAARPFAGTARLLFQPAEEINAGARAMMEAGALDGVAEIYGLHNLPTLPAGRVATRSGPMMGSVDRIEIELEGKGAHGAIPDQGIDPIVCASAVIQSLQSLVSREVSPFAPVAVTIGFVQAGEANNVIPQTCRMTGTIRAFDPSVRQLLPDAVERIVRGIADAYRCTARLNYIHQVPVLVNREENTRFVEAAIDGILGRERRGPAAPTLAGEDFALYLEKLPGCFFWLGSGPLQDAESAYGLHHPRYRLHEECIPVGSALLAGIALSRLSESPDALSAAPAR
ncbi:M20 family metallopeptidase [Paenibacillaceae bacterium WGS1546]|uniref:M20 metallopeptidase family protein n=1 Tax=Cohnella sp. WGS1546 TaxID=3366810 RepID=UPI00372D08DB